MSVYWKTTQPSHIATFQRFGDSVNAWRMRIDEANRTLTGWRFVKYRDSLGFTAKLEPVDGNDGTNPPPPVGWTYSRSRGNAKPRSDRAHARALAKEVSGPSFYQLLSELGVEDVHKGLRWFSPGLNLFDGVLYLTWQDEAEWEGADGFERVKASEFFLAAEGDEERVNGVSA